MSEKTFIELWREIRALKEEIRPLLQTETVSYHARSAREKEIVSGAITVNRSHIVLLPEGYPGVTVDDLTTINGGADGKLLVLRAGTGYTITVKHGLVNIDLMGSTNDVVLDDPIKTLRLIYLADEATWVRFDYMTLDDLFGVYIGSPPTANDVLTWTGADWQPQSLVGGGATVKHGENIGDGVTTAINVNHGLGTSDVVISVYEIASGDQVYPDIALVDNNNATVTFAVAPTLDQYRVVVIG